MADTQSAISVGPDWTDLSALSGIAAGTEVLVQNIGDPQDLLVLWTGASQPAASERGSFVKQFEQWRIDSGEATVWGRYLVRHGKVTTGKTLLVQYQDAS